LREGVIGSPRFINPLLAISDTDRDLTALIYSGLMKATPEGDLIEDLAKSFDVSDDGLVYTFEIREDAIFHDGTPVTADDVVFTIKMAQSDLLKSPRRAAWDSVRVTRVNNRVVAFGLERPYFPFLENTTIGILPSHIWGALQIEQITFSDFNANPIGSGPFELRGVEKNSSGIPETYNLKSFDKYALGKPFIKEVIIKFYSNEEELVKAYKRGGVSSVNAISPNQARELEDDGANIISFPLPRVFGVFFNQSQATLFTNKEVRVALEVALDKDRIVREILNEYGESIDSPIPPGISIERKKAERKVTLNEEGEIITGTLEAIDILERNGWERGEDGIMVKETRKEDFRLNFSISTSNAPELKQAANIIKEEWEKIGAEVEVRLFEAGVLNQDIIRPRAYDSLLFGEIVGRDLDLFAFWHSSQRNDPGLNIALYANITVDKLLEDIRSSSDRREKMDKYQELEEEISNDVPAIFLYSPDFIYATPEKIKDLKLGIVTTPSERFLNIHQWHTKTERVWKIFAN